MLKVSAGLAVVAVVLLLISVIPWSAAEPVNWVEPGVSATATAADPSFVDSEPGSGQDLVAEGRALFRLKGCVTCHRHDAVVVLRPGSSEEFIQGDGAAPNLTNYQADPEFLRLWLKDPAAVRPGTRMPNLELKEEEIEALIAFLADAEGSGP